MNVLIFDKNPILSVSLSKELNGSCVCTCDSRSNLSDLYSETLEVDVMVLDPSHLELKQEYDIVDFAARMRKGNPSIKMVAYSFDLSATLVRASLAAGFSACISKSSSLERLELALAAAWNGGLYFDELFSSHATQAFSKSISKSFKANKLSDDILSSREQEVLTLVARGFPSKSIAQNLNISSKTVDTYRSRASQKLKLSSRSEIFDYAVQQGWVSV